MPGEGNGAVKGLAKRKSGSEHVFRTFSVLISAFKNAGIGRNETSDNGWNFLVDLNVVPRSVVGSRERENYYRGGLLPRIPISHGSFPG